MTSKEPENYIQDGKENATASHRSLESEALLHDIEMTANTDKEFVAVPVENDVELKDLKKIDSEKAQTDVVEPCFNEDNDDSYDISRCGRCVERLETAVGQVYVRYQRIIVFGMKSVLLMLYFAYFGYCMYYRFGDEGSIVLLVGTVLFVIYLLYKLLLYRGGTCSTPLCLQTCFTTKRGKRIRTVLRYSLYLMATAGLALFLGLDILRYHPRNRQSFLGIAALIFLGYAVSKKPSRVNWHPVFWGFVIQFVFATLTLRTDVGYNAFKWIGNVVQTLVHFSDKGSAFVLGNNFKLMGLAFSASGVIIFFNAIIFLLNHWGILEIIIVKFGRFLSMCLDTGPVESVTAAANIFIGLSEAPLLIRPYLASLSRSELCAVMTCGFASVSGGIMGLFIQFGAPANHLLTAAVISAPAALAFAKLMHPELERVDMSAQQNIQMRDKSDKTGNVISALSDGAVMAVKIIMPIMANMLAFVSVLQMIDTILDWFGQRAGISGLTFDLICSYVLYPLSYAMGTEPADCGMVGSLIGIKLFATPMVGYAELGKIIENRKTFEKYLSSGNGTWYWSGPDIILEAVNVTLFKGVMSERSEVIATYAMCGFSAFTAIGICIGTLTPMCPTRKQDVIELVLLAFFAGNMASFATGAVAGVMYTDHSVRQSL